MFPVWQQRGKIGPFWRDPGASRLDSVAGSAIPWCMTLIRKAEPKDLAGIVALQLASWRRTYRDVLPEAYLRLPLERDLSATWTAARLQDALVLVAEHDGGILGVAATFPDAEGGPYLDNLHVAATAEGAGAGAV